MSSSTYLSIVTRLFFARYWWCFAIVPTVLAVASIVLADSRYVLAALIIVIAIVPMAMPLIFYYYALTPEARCSIMPHSLSWDEEGMTFTFTQDEVKPVDIAWKKIARRRVSRECLLLMLDDRRLQFVAIPLNAFEGEAHLRSFLSQL